MATYIPVSKPKHLTFGWLRPPDYRHTAAVAMVPLLVDEIAAALATLPLAFRRQRETSGKVAYQLVALLSPLAGQNLFLNPDGSWSAGHVPLSLRCYPFRRMIHAATGEPIVCIDQDSGLLTPAGTPGSVPFFDGEGAPGPAFQEILALLQHCEQRRALTQRAVDTLAELNLITPWKLLVKDESGREQGGAVNVCKIDGAALQNLSAEQLAQLHACGALIIAHAQLLSEPRVQNFSQLLQRQTPAQPPQANPAPPVNLDTFFSADAGLIKFKNV